MCLSASASQEREKKDHEEKEFLRESPTAADRTEVRTESLGITTRLAPAWSKWFFSLVVVDQASAGLERSVCVGRWEEKKRFEMGLVEGDLVSLVPF